MKPFRRLATSDAIVLATATVLGVYSAHATMTSLADISRLSHYGARQWKAGAACVFFAWMAALLLLRLRQPRPTLRRLARQPGFVAECSAVLAVTIGVLWNVDSQTIRGIDPVPLSVTVVATLSPTSIAIAISSSWLILSLTGIWKTEKSWIDRTGILLGAIWVLYSVL